MPVAAPAKHAVAAYAEAVVSGEIVAGRLVRLACQRHLDDLEHGHERGLRFDEAAADKALSFFGLLKLAEGEHEGQPFVLQPWQQFVIGSLFGWKASDGTRRFRTAYLEIGKGNGKSPMAAGIGLYGLLGDGEAAAEIYSAATVKDQAKILFRDAENMVKASPALARRVDQRVNNLAVLASNSYFRPVSSEHRGLDGKRVHIALIDELHEHPNATVVDKMRAGTKGRRNPLIFEITNSGYDRHSVCFQHREYSEKVLTDQLPNDSWFAYVCGLDPCDACRAEGAVAPKDDCERCDNWQDEAVWLKANPNLGVSITLKYLREQVAEAKGMPAKQGIVKRLNFCIWTEQVTRWVPLDLWDQAGPQTPLAELRGRPCFAALDLASTIDIAALTLWFPDRDGPDEDNDEGGDLLAWFWVPEDNIDARVKRDKVPYDVWVRDGLIEATPGNVTDYDFIREQVNSLAQTYDIAEIAYDPWNATQLAVQLQGDGATMVPFRQGYVSMNEPCKSFERLVMKGLIRHGGNPVLRWMLGNVAVRTDPAGNIKLDKERSPEKIDGIVAGVMAIGRASVHATSGRSMYEDEDLFVIG